MLHIIEIEPLVGMHTFRLVQLAASKLKTLLACVDI